VAQYFHPVTILALCRGNLWQDHNILAALYPPWRPCPATAKKSIIGTGTQSSMVHFVYQPPSFVSSVVHFVYQPPSFVSSVVHFVYQPPSLRVTKGRGPATNMSSIPTPLPLRATRGSADGSGLQISKCKSVKSGRIHLIMMDFCVYIYWGSACIYLWRMLASIYRERHASV
jgi:hypothetical protein